MERIKVSSGVFLVQIPEAGLSVLCGCPPDVVKTLMKRGLIVETSQGGVSFETGPNAILLSDITVQGGTFCNMAEFPILQMFYNQGMILPRHPGNTGRKPLILGLSQQIHAQGRYIARGTYGLTDPAELAAAGIKPEAVREIIRYKTRFAGGKLDAFEERIDFVALDSGRAELPKGVAVERRGLNRYAFLHEGKEIDVDLNLEPGQTYEAPVRLDFHHVQPGYFSVIHIGEGDGWDRDRPCMSSIVCFQGKYYLIDTGPNVLNSLTALGISANEIEGIFHTHAHDDHFAGLTSLVRTDHRIKYFATPLVRSSVMKKLAALMSLPERSFDNTFEFHDLRFGKWNNIDGLEVMPVLSLHPVETSVLQFRALWEGGYKSYVHLADIPSLKVMDDYLIHSEGAGEMAARIRDDLSDTMFAPADLKKVDIGGGLIHGNAMDFAGDTSAKIVLSHTSHDLTARQKEIGSTAAFGTQDILIEAHQDYAARMAGTYLGNHFPEASPYDLDMLLNCPTVAVNAGEFLQRRGVADGNLRLVLHGVVEVIDSSSGIIRIASAGSLLGELEALSNEAPRVTCRAKSHVSVIQIPCRLYSAFMSRTYDLDEARMLRERGNFLQSTWLFGEMISSMVQNRLSRETSELRAKAGERIGTDDDDNLYILRAGKATIRFESRDIDRMEPGDVYGEESVFFQRSSMMTAFAETDVRLFVIPARTLAGIPIAVWKLLEVYERRLASYGSLMSGA